MKTFFSGLNALFWGTKLAKDPFYSIGTTMMVGSVSKHFANLRHVKRCKTCVSGLNALFCSTKVAKHPFYSIRTKMMIGSVSEHFANLRTVKRCKTCVRVRMHYFGYQSCEASILLYWNQNNVWECFGAFC
jgi:acid stress-induced BolA-like protein IbaG/YrbA